MLCCILAVVQVAAAGEEEPSRAELKKRLEAAENRNAALEKRVDALESKDATSIREAVDAYLQQTADAAAGGEEGEGVGLAIDLRNGAVRVNIQIFGDSGFMYRNPRPSDRGHASFFLGQATWFMTAQVGEHFQMLSETVVDVGSNAKKDTVLLDQERLWGSWTFSDLLYIKFGLEHGPISRWNRVYHHGRWLETSIVRPLLAAFEGSGILPMHNSGVEIGGRVQTRLGMVEYAVLIVNGRGRIVTDPQKVSDRNDHKAIELSFSLRPKAVVGMLFGIGLRADEIPGDPSEPTRLRSIRQLIGTAFIEYRSERIEILAEFAYVEDKDRTTGSTFGHHTGYIQVAFHIDDRWTPYGRAEYRNMQNGDPFYLLAGRDLDIWDMVFGLRIDLTSNVAFKIEVITGSQDVRTGSGIVARWFTKVGAQLSWVF